MSTTRCPRKVLDARVRTVRGTQFVARGPDVYELNEVAAEIWKLCDGTRTEDEIGIELAERYTVELERVTADVTGLIGELAEIGFVDIVEHRETSNGAAAPSAYEGKEV
jgi:hypothetical protein